MERILKNMPVHIQNNIMNLPRGVISSIQEIRVRAGFPIMIVTGQKEYSLGTSIDGQSGVVDKELLYTILNAMISYSIHAVQEELAQGYITLKGGHRVGVCGRVVMEKGRIQSIKDISSLNIRRSREIKGISDRVMPYIYKDKDRTMIHNTLIVSPPGCGKTTLLRDIIRQLSKGGKRVGVVDERSELAAVSDGLTQYDLGQRTDVMDGCPKDRGIMMMIRSMAPAIIATDEMGKPEDVHAVNMALCAGVSLITTIHGTDWEDLQASEIGSLIKKGVFGRLIYLSRHPAIGTVSRITDGENNNVD